MKISPSRALVVALVTSASCLPLIPFAARAETPLPEDATVIVTATRSALAARKIPADVDVTSRQAIDRATGQSVDDVLRKTVPDLEMPPLASYQEHPTSSLISMRGTKSGYTSHVLVLLDGVPINDPFSGYVQWNRVPLSAIARVEVVRGGGSTLWGSYALGGVVNIVTRAPDGKGLSLDAGAGSNATWRASADGSFKASDRVILSAGFSHFETGGFHQVDAQWRNPNTIWRKTPFVSDNVRLGTNVTLGDGLTWRTHLNLHSNHQGLNDYVSTNKHNILNFDTALIQALGANQTLTYALFHNDGDFRTNNSGYDYGQFPTQAWLSNAHKTAVHDTGASVVWTRTSDGVLAALTLGADARLIKGYDHSDVYDDVHGSVSGTANAYLGRVVGSGQQLYSGVFGQALLNPAPKLDLQISARAQSWKNSKGYVDVPVFGLPGAQADRSATSVDPRLNVRYRLTDVLSVRAAAYTAFNAPTLDNLYRSYAAGGFSYPSNPTMQAEHLRGTEAGFDVALPAVTFAATAFDNRTKNAIVTDSVTFGPINAGAVDAHGYDISARWRVSAQWTLQADATETISTITASSDAASIGQQIAQLPKHQYRLDATYASGPLDIDLAGRWVGASFGQNGTPWSPWPIAQPAYFALDAKAAFALSHGLKLYVEGSNLTNAHYIADASGYAAPLRGQPRTVFVGLSWRQ